MVADDLGNRMKAFYENRSKTYLTRRAPVIIRIDGCHFHTFCHGLRKPYDPIFIKTMQLTCKDLCQSIQGCKLGYVESDEISLLLIDYDKLTTDAWFDYQVQKICSVAASMTTMFFNRNFIKLVEDFGRQSEDAWRPDDPDLRYYEDVLLKKVDMGAYFDARCFNIPENEITNYFIWRQNDATRNSIQGLGQAHFSQKKLQGLNNSQVQDLLINEKSINWNDYSVVEKRGTCIKRIQGNWTIDNDIPIFTKARGYIEAVIPRLM